MWTEIAIAIGKAIDQSFTIEQTRSVGGGCINQGYQISGQDNSYFVKLNSPNQGEMFAAEALGLKQMAQTQTIKVPQPICWGETDKHSYIVMEWLEFGPNQSSAWEAMGQKLAQMHQYQQADRFGWEINNTIGSTPQINDWTDSWADFFAQHRIGYQLKLAKRRGGSFPDTDIVVEAVREALGDRKPQPSLVHGDLWSGNAAVIVDGTPVILDPAAYWGDREVDLAMTELFGGFPAAFYRGYNRVWELDSGYRDRKKIYNLYHILNHFNLFGGGYGSQAQTTIAAIL